MLNDVIKANIQLNATRRMLQAVQNKPFRNRSKIKKLQAIEEGQRDILNTAITRAQSTSPVVDKNNYKTYSSQVNKCYDLYNAECDYGAEFFRSIIETRISFISGEGLSIDATNKATKKYIEKFLKYNLLNGSNLLKINEVGELEGKVLVTLHPTLIREDSFDYKIYPDNKGYIRLDIFSWWENNYNVLYKNGAFEKAVYTEKDNGNEITISNKKAEYIRLGGTWRNFNNTSSKVHTVLTQIENASRAGYDLRKNSHYFGKITPYWRTQDRSSAASINKDVQNATWEIGLGYAGTADFNYVEPSGSATDVNKTDLLLSLKAISSTTGIPIHWLAWPELMSNRATADNMMEIIAAATRKERLLYEEGITNIIKKSMLIAIEEGYENNNILGDFQVKLPLISVTMIKQLSETWLPLQQNDVISMSTLRGRIPGVDPIIEEKLIGEEKQKNAESFMGLNDGNKIINDRLREQQGNKDEDVRE